jgi:hypothetical protein
VRRKGKIWDLKCDPILVAFTVNFVLVLSFVLVSTTFEVLSATTIVFFRQGVDLNVSRMRSLH